ncbi:MAG: hypothetical protein ABI810_13685 [Sphingomonas bacterium]
MQRFFFHIVNDVAFTRDEEGQEFANLADACREARRTIGEIIAQDVTGGLDTVHLTIMIDDETAARVANIKAVTHMVVSLSPFAI